MSAAYAARAIYGAWRLARGDAGGMAYFEDSVTGFWRSFWAAGIILPFYLLLISLRLAGSEVELNPLRYYTAEMIAYVIAWTAFPVVMLSVAPALERKDHYIRYIVAYNWAAVLQNAVYMPLGLLHFAGVLPSDGATFLLLVALGVILMYTWFVTVTALEVNGAVAAALVAGDFVLSLFIDSLADTAALR